MKNSVLLRLALAGLLAGCSHDQPATNAAATTAVVADSLAAPGAVATTYTCPMHPEVLRPEPGQCPKCHMDLEVKN